MLNLVKKNTCQYFGEGGSTIYKSLPPLSLKCTATEIGYLIVSSYILNSTVNTIWNFLNVPEPGADIHGPARRSVLFELLLRA